MTARVPFFFDIYIYIYIYIYIHEFVFPRPCAYAFACVSICCIILYSLVHAYQSISLLFNRSSQRNFHNELYGFFYFSIVMARIMLNNNIICVNQYGRRENRDTLFV